MKEKIELYREMLQEDPRSRAFFPLAEAFHEAGRSGEAVSVLREGLRWHPDFLEARFLLIQILWMSGDRRVLEEMAPVARILEKYPCFWGVWAELAGGEGSRLALPLRFLSAMLEQPELNLESVFEQGLAGLGKTPSGVEPAAMKPVPHADADEVLSRMMPEPFDGAVAAHEQETPGTPLFREDVHGEEPSATDFEFPSFRTRSMANVLAEQGDFVGALEIYRELEGRTSDEEERRALQACIQLLEKRMGGSASPETASEENACAEFSDSAELNELLESLADRLEARARSGASVMSGEC